MKTIITLLFLSTILFGCLNSSNPYSETHGEIKQNSISTLSDDELKSIALEKNDITYCDKLQYLSDKNECYLNLALKYQNPSYCSKILDQMQKDNCLNRFNNTNHLNQTVQTNKLCKTDCFTEAMETNDSTYCEQIKFDAIRYNCYVNLALKLKDRSYCSQIPAADANKFCNYKMDAQEYLASHTKSDMQIETNSIDSIAPASTDNTINTLNDEVKQCNHDYSCLTTLAIEHDNIGICANDYSCITSVALTYNKSQYCKTLSDGYDSGACLHNFETLD